VEKPNKTMANIFKNYIDYIKDNPQGYWFRARWFGWGWTPATKEGWAVLSGFVLSLAIIVILLNKALVRNQSPLKYLIGIVVLTFIFIYIAYKKGEKPHWSWGPLRKDK
jgi:hypothetical protein